MDAILAFKKDLDEYTTGDLHILAKYLKVPITNRGDLIWLLAIEQAKTHRIGRMNGKPKLYIVAGSPGSGKSTSIDYLREKGVVPKDILIIDRDALAEEFNPEKRIEVVKERYPDPELRKFYIASAVKEILKSANILYKEQVEKALEKKKDLLIFFPPEYPWAPTEWRQKTADYDIKVIFIYVEPKTAQQRAKKRAETSWISVGEPDIYCGWSASLAQLETYCKEGTTCYVCDNRQDIKCMTLEKFKEEYSLPSATEAAEECYQKQVETAAEWRRIMEEEIASSGDGESITTSGDSSTLVYE